MLIQVNKLPNKLSFYKKTVYLSNERAIIWLKVLLNDSWSLK